MNLKKSIVFILLIALFMGSVIQPANFAVEEKVNDWPLMKEAIYYFDQKDYAKAVYYWEELVKLYDNYSTITTYENGGHMAVKAGDYYAGLYDPSIFDAQKATYYYEKAYNSYLKFAELSGTTKNNWAFVSVKKKLDDIKTEIILYMKKEIVQTPPITRELAKFEPESGLFLGIYGEGNESLIKNFGVDPTLVENLYGKAHASLLYYNVYGETPFSTTAAAKMKAVDGSLQIHMQPEVLADVKDEDYLRQWARDAKASGIPIFLRFGGEMNGNWVPWGLQPELYIKKFRLVHDIMAEEAPNVAMVWAPNFYPWDNMAQFYPGDAYVDWVGVSCYTTLSYTADTKETKLKSNPIDLLSYIVSEYGARKPIMIVEGAVSYTAGLEPNIDYTDWAINNLRRFYSYIPLVYPEIKAMFYYDARGAAGGKESYVLSANPALKSVYNEIIRKEYFLSSMTDSAPFKYEAVNASVEKKIVNFSTYVKSFEPVIAKVDYFVNGKRVVTSTKIPFEFNFDFTNFTLPTANITVKAYLADGRVAGVKEYKVSVVQPQIRVIYKGETVRFDQPPVVVSGRTMVPMKRVFETLGMSVQYISTTKTIIAKDTKNEIILTIGSDKAIVNGVTVILDVPAATLSGRTMVPLKFIGQSVGLTVTFDSPSRTINID